MGYSQPVFNLKASVTKKEEKKEEEVDQQAKPPNPRITAKQPKPVA